MRRAYYLALSLLALVACSSTVQSPKPQGLAATTAQPPALGAAANVRFHYADIEAAARFYRDQLGLLPVAVRKDEIVLEVASGAYLTLASMAVR